MKNLILVIILSAVSLNALAESDFIASSDYYGVRCVAHGSDFYGETTAKAFKNKGLKSVVMKLPVGYVGASNNTTTTLRFKVTVGFEKGSYLLEGQDGYGNNLRIDSSTTSQFQLDTASGIRNVVCGFTTGNDLLEMDWGSSVPSY